MNKVALLNAVGIVGDGLGCPLVEALSERITDDAAFLIIVAVSKQDPSKRKLLEAIGRGEKPQPVPDPSEPGAESEFSLGDVAVSTIIVAAGLAGAALIDSLFGHTGGHA